MPEMIEVVNPATGEKQWQSPLNARDLINHQGWEVSKTGSAPQIFSDGESATSEQIDLIGNQRVKDNRRVVDETGVSNTEHLQSTAALATGGDPEKIVKDEGVDDIEGEEDGEGDGTDGDDDDDKPEVNPAAPNGIVRNTAGELVDDELVNALKGKNKQALVAYAKSKHGLDLDGRKSEDSLRLAIYDAAQPAQ